MIVVRLMGGLGNQLFQFATGRRLATRHGSELVLDLGWFRHEARHYDTPRRYELGGLGLNARTIALRPRVVKTLEAGRRPPFSSLRLRVIRQLETNFQFDDRVLAAPDEVLLIGYWQSECYFADAAEIVRAELGLHESKVPSCVAVHIRRGDYVSSAHARDFHGVLDLDYYRRAFEYVAERVADPVFLAFSDEPEWVDRELVPEFPLTLASTGDATQDFRLMSRCAHHVIANSSFSWWGAWLGERDESVIVAPQRWFADPRVDSREVVPARWQRL